MTADGWMTLSGIDASLSDPEPNVCQGVLKWLKTPLNPNPKIDGCSQTLDILKKPIDSSILMPSYLARIARVPQFKADFLRTPNYVYAVPEGSPKGTNPGIYPNPDHGLLSVGGVLDFGELFLDSGKRVTYCEARLSLVRASSSSNIGRCADAKYLNAAGKIDILERYASATVVNVTVSQIPQFQSGVIISPTSPAYGLNWSFTVTGSISPSVLFESAAQRKGFADYYKGHHQELRTLGSLDLGDGCRGSSESSDATPSRACLNSLATVTSVKERLLIAILPRIDVKAYTAFDFSKTGGNSFIAVPESNKALYDFTLTWDLRNTIPSIQMRSDALSAYQSVLTMKKARKEEQIDGLNQSAKAKLAEDFVKLKKDPDLACRGESWWSDFRDIYVTFTMSKPTPSLK